MTTAEEIFYKHVEGVGTKESIIAAMEEYTIQKLEQTVASYEIDRVNLVAMTLERDEFDEENKRLADMLKMSATAYNELTESHDDLKARFTACKDECLRLGEMVTELQDELESAITEKQVANTSIDILSNEADRYREALEKIEEGQFRLSTLEMYLKAKAALHPDD
jgi:uncharacterized phage infection (PIP) family protein YhgE